MFFPQFTKELKYPLILAPELLWAFIFLNFKVLSFSHQQIKIPSYNIFRNLSKKIMLLIIFCVPDTMLNSLHVKQSTSFHPHMPTRKGPLFAHSTDWETEAHRGEVIRPLFHSRPASEHEC